MDLYCLTVASARLMLFEFLVWLALPALSSAPHLDGHHFSVNGASLTGPLSACARTTPAHPASATPTMPDSFMGLSPSLRVRGHCGGERRADGRGNAMRTTPFLRRAARKYRSADICIAWR